MKLKTGPLLIVAVLVVLVGMTLLLTPAPPPEQAAQDHEAEAKAAEDQNQKQKPAPQATLAGVKAQLAKPDQHAQSEGLQELNTLAVTARNEQRKPVIEYLTTLLKDPRENVRASAVNVLGSIVNLNGSEDIDYRIILNTARTDRSPDVQRAAILALAKFKSGGPVEQALREFAKHPDAGVRSIAIVSLTQMLSGSASNQELARLLGVFDNDASAKTAMTFHSQGERALPVLIDTVYRNPSGPARQAAAMCISLICAGFNPSIEAFAKQAQVTHRQDAGHRASNPRGVEPLLWALKNDPYAPTREIAAQGLGYLGDERAAKPLAAALSDPDAYVRRRAAAALVTVPATTVIPELSAAATRDTHPEVRRFAVEALGWIKTPQVVPALNQATTDADPTVRRYAAIELGRIADPSSLDALSAMLDGTPDPDADVRWAAVVALGKLRDRRAEKVLVAAMADTSPQVSTAAERALQRLGIARTEEAGYQG